MIRLLIPLSMLAVEAAALVYASGSWPLPVLLLGAALGSAATGLGVPLAPAHRYRVVLGLAAVFSLQGRFYPLVIPVSLQSTPFDYPQLHALAQCLFAIQVALLIARPSPLDPEEGRTAFWGLCGIGSITAATTFSAHGTAWTIVNTLYVLFAIQIALLFWSRSPLSWRNLLHPRSAVALLLLLAASTLGVLSSQGLRNNISAIDQRFAQLTNGMNGRSAGLSGQGGLHAVSDVKSRDALALVAQVESTSTPGYLRAHAFDQFDGRNWRNMMEVQRDAIAAARPDTLPALPPAQHWFPLTAARADAEAPVRIWLEDPNTRTFLLPDRAAWVGTQATTLWRDDNGVVGLDRAIPGAYRVASAPAVAAPVVPPDTATYTQLHDNVDPRVVSLANELFHGAQYDSEKVQAVLAYFRGNYTYRLGYRPPADWDALTHFLIEQPAAHCEYFATGAALLLRLGGVPCRYVTGAVATEQNPVSGVWVARRRDAHAWVEVWAADHGWSRIDPTPGGPGDGEGNTVPARQYLAEAARQQWRALWDGLRNDALAMVKGAWVAATTFLSQTWAGRAGLVLAVLVLLWTKGRHWTRWRPQARPTQTPLSRLLRQVDAQARREGYVRAPSETVHAFAARIDAADLAGWYRAYAALRYDPRVEAKAAITKLTQAAARILRR